MNKNVKKIFKQIKFFAILVFLSSFLFSGCFTGVEGTKKISAKEVTKADASELNITISEIDTLKSQPISKWISGKKFFVTDNQIKYILTTEDSLSSKEFNLENNYIYYKGYSEENMLGIDKKLVIIFKDANNNTYKYKSPIAEIDNSTLNIPFLIDMDMVEKARNLILNKDYYIKTQLWYDRKDNAITGEKFIKVSILDVLPGNKVYSIKIKFKTPEKEAFIFVSTKDTPILNRSFDNIFSATNPKDKYPLISDKNWKLISNGEIINEMTKEECQLSLGSPKMIDKIPTYQGLREIWQYDNGVYLIFEDGILVKYRK